MALVYDFPAIASRLRRDDFYAPSKPTIELPPLVTILCCQNCLTSIMPNQPRWGSNGNPYVTCPNCGLNQPA
jgi:hypothetical protein